MNLYFQIFGCNRFSFFTIFNSSNSWLHRLSILVLLSFVNSVDASSRFVPKEWKAITVSVSANNKVETRHKLTLAEGGLQKLNIIMSNNGKAAVTIDSIEIRIPISKSINNNMKVAYGSSSMGQRPVFIHNVGDSKINSYSYMYSMVQSSTKQFVFAGALSWRIFIPIITLENNTFVIRSKGEGKQIKPGESISYEQLVLTVASDWQDLLHLFGSAVAEENGITKIKEANFKGWATWDYYAYKFSDKDIYQNMDVIKQLNSSVNLIQIDAGWYSQRGDFSTSRSDLPGGMKIIADRIKAAGMIPGIWIDGFRANTDSKIFKEHPEYFLHDNEGNLIIQIRRPEGPDKDRVYIDYSHPGAQDFMSNNIRAITKEFGIPYIKIDFIVYGLNQEILKANPKFKTIKPYNSTITDVERLRIGLKTMRSAAGSDTYFLGCSAVFGPIVGLVDGMRTGGDISPRFEEFPERVLANAGNSYLCGKVFSGDADYLVFREAADEDSTVSEEKVKRNGNLKINEAQMWADFNKLYGNFRLSSDKLSTLRQERKSLIQDVFNFAPMDETVPLDFWQHGKDKADGYELILARSNNDIYLGIFNWGDAPKEYNLDAFGCGLQKLNGRHSKVLKYTGARSFTKVRKKLISNLNE